MSVASHAVTAPWQATASYLYILSLDRPALAWEYLRRHPDYGTCWTCQHKSDPAVSREHAVRWGLRYLEDPTRDARDAHPQWFDEPVSLLHVRGADPFVQSPDISCPGFDVWRIPGRKHLVLTDRGITLQAVERSRWLRLALDTRVLGGGPCWYAVPADRRLRAHLLGLYAQTGLWRGRSTRAESKGAQAPRGSTQRAALGGIVHLRALLALDARHAGAIERDIGAALFGQDAVDSQWHADSALRAQVRYALAHGTDLMRGGYRRLLHARP